MVASSLLSLVPRREEMMKLTEELREGRTWMSEGSLHPDN
jgi:hypothetical protein